jgi:hypothetical protein
MREVAVAHRGHAGTGRAVDWEEERIFLVLSETVTGEKLPVYSDVDSRTDLDGLQCLWFGIGGTRK